MTFPDPRGKSLTFLDFQASVETSILMRGLIDKFKNKYEESSDKILMALIILYFTLMKTDFLETMCIYILAQRNFRTPEQESSLKLI